MNLDVPTETVKVVSYDDVMDSLHEAVTETLNFLLEDFEIDVTDSDVLVRGKRLTAVVAQIAGRLAPDVKAEALPSLAWLRSWVNAQGEDTYVSFASVTKK